ncbi:hypothetical protein JK211_15575 [Tatumella sp. JGM130]|uniref:hypothetical protein n=1 Tax=Tatumella sp. JGM130 TaxID=2799797 RepID=UPI001BAFFDC1|nr:hypothetical protein [Tatumella sp. JGM130]MBS0895415.1 hypothetical protein [Tatumella sp. JGM130]MBS0895427.1 hypothetical protein [Tatumella sp. JGM130]
MSKMIISTDTLPEEFKLIELHGFVQYTHRIEISNKGFIRNITERKRNENQEALDGFTNSAGADGNIIYGVKITTATGQFKDATYLYMTYCGTLATVERVE